MPKSLRMKLDLRDSSDFHVPMSKRRVGVVSGTDAVYTISPTALTGFTGDISLSVTGLPTGASSEISDSNIAYYESSTVTVSTSGVTGGTYNFLIGAELAGAGNYDWLLVDYAIRLTDWSTVGVPGGIAQYRAGGANARTLGRNVVTQHGADNTGASDCTSAFNAASSACSANSYIYIPNGTYLINGTVNLNKSNITWRGQSVTGTIIKFGSSGGFGTSSEWPPPTYSANGVAVTSGATKGSKTLTLGNTSTFTAGKMAQLTSLTESFQHVNSANSWEPGEWFGYDSTRLASCLFTVVSKTSNTVTLDHGLPRNMNSSPLLMPRDVLISGTGFENIQFDCTDSRQNQVVNFYNVTACWIYGCYFKTMYDRSAWFEIVTNCTFEHNHSDNGQGLGRNCEGLDWTGNDCWCLTQDNTFQSAGYPMVMIGDWDGGCAGNVVAYNYQRDFDQGYDLSTYPLTMDDSHGPHNWYNLWEGNVMEVWGSDGYYGSSSHGTALRNRIWGTTSKLDYADQTCLELNHWSYQYNIIGNILGTPQGSDWGITGRYSQIFEASGGSSQAPQIYRLGYPDMGNRSYSGSSENPTSSTSYDTGVKTSMLRHGNFDYVNNSVLWTAGISSHDIPNSLYLTSKPSWFGSAAWPAIGPDVSGYYTNIPAAARWAAYVSSGNLADLF